MPAIEFVSMAEGEDWLLRPVRAGMCLYESLKNGAVNLNDIALMNESLDVEAENRYRLHKATTPNSIPRR